MVCQNDSRCCCLVLVAFSATQMLICVTSSVVVRLEERVEKVCLSLHSFQGETASKNFKFLAGNSRVEPCQEWTFHTTNYSRKAYNVITQLGYVTCLAEQRNKDCGGQFDLGKLVCDGRVALLFEAVVST